MRRWLTIFLLVLLPMQFVWASAASYCQHEQNVKAAHVGHHEHQHDDASPAAEQAAADDTSSSSAGINHADCSYCHLSCAKSFACARPDYAVPMREAFASGVVQGHLSPLHERIERPNWQRAA